MAKTALAEAMDAIQAKLHPLFKQAAFRKQGRTYNRSTPDGLVHVVGFQMGAFDPPGTTAIPGFRENLHGRFTVNLGIYVPEVARHQLGGEAKAVVHEYNCCIRTRLGRTEREEVWWKVCLDEEVIEDLHRRLEAEAVPLFQRFQSRDQIVSEFGSVDDNQPLIVVPKIVCAIIEHGRGRIAEAGRLLSEHIIAYRANPTNPHHVDYVHRLASQLGIAIVD